MEDESKQQNLAYIASRFADNFIVDIRKFCKKNGIHGNDMVDFLYSVSAQFTANSLIIANKEAGNFEGLLSKSISIHGTLVARYLKILR